MLDAEDLRSMQAMFRHWDTWNVAHRKSSNLPDNEDAHVMAVPFGWPTHGTLRTWAKLMGDAAAEVDALRALIRDDCDEVKARQRLSFEQAEAIFSETK